MLMQEEPEYVIRRKNIGIQDFFHHSSAEIKFKNAIATLTARQNIQC